MDAQAEHFRKWLGTQLLRRAYMQSANHGGKINREWEALDDEAWARLDALATDVEEDD